MNPSPRRALVRMLPVRASAALSSVDPRRTGQSLCQNDCAQIKAAMPQVRIRNRIRNSNPIPSFEVR